MRKDVNYVDMKSGSTIPRHSMGLAYLHTLTPGQPPSCWRQTPYMECLGLISVEYPVFNESCRSSWCEPEGAKSWPREIHAVSAPGNKRGVHKGLAI